MFNDLHKISKINFKLFELIKSVYKSVKQILLELKYTFILLK